MTDHIDMTACTDLGGAAARQENSPIIQCECKGQIFTVPCRRCNGSGYRPMTMNDRPDPPVDINAAFDKWRALVLQDRPTGALTTREAFAAGFALGRGREGRK
jgi:hypothetical protein